MATEAAMLGKILPVKFNTRLSSEQDEAEPVEANVEWRIQVGTRRIRHQLSGGQDVRFSQAPCGRWTAECGRGLLVFAVLCPPLGSSSPITRKTGNLAGRGVCAGFDRIGIEPEA